MKKTWMMLGLLSLAMCGCEMSHSGAMAKDKENNEANEVKVPIEQVPAAVRATLARESGGAAIKDVDKESDEGKTIYEADAMIGAQNYEIKVAEDGTLVKKAIDNEDKEKAEAGEKGEKGEKEEKEEKGEH